ncbi:Soluble epoxide hydrolase [Dermatophilus congolensis]|uniref:Soluble epoxide hydrolase n=1 Tax=Dermatophilus congolensis TaxID=1863 RepID=A0AA46BQ83_9MICO|nr:Soluble epoxide hydrolase [Dermatophilus congolensis]
MLPLHKLIRVTSGHIAVRDFGGDRGIDQPTILLIHNVCDNARAWDHIAPALTSYGRVLALDLRGHGQSTAPLRETAEFATDLHSIANATGTTSFVLVGHLWGGDIALWSARLAPEIVSAACLIDAPISLPPTPYAELLAFINDPFVLSSIAQRLRLDIYGHGTASLNQFVNAAATALQKDWMSPTDLREEALTQVRHSIRSGPEGLWFRTPTRETLYTYSHCACRGEDISAIGMDALTIPIWLLHPHTGRFYNGYTHFRSIENKRPTWQARVIQGGSNGNDLRATPLTQAICHFLDSLPYGHALTQ